MDRKRKGKSFIGFRKKGVWDLKAEKDTIWWAGMEQQYFLRGSAARLCRAL